MKMELEILGATHKLEEYTERQSKAQTRYALNRILREQELREVAKKIALLLVESKARINELTTIWSGVQSMLIVGKDEE